jgi:hypothetical protein
VPYYRGEDFRMRHARRLSANLEQEANVRRWYEQRGLTLRITNEGHHWQIADGGFGRMVAIERKTRDWQKMARRNSLS